MELDAWRGELTVALDVFKILPQASPLTLYLNTGHSVDLFKTNMDGKPGFENYFNTQL